jgi:DNA-directed RNA polymerase subunit RPC12/RpoP
MGSMQREYKCASGCGAVDSATTGLTVTQVADALGDWIYIPTYNGTVLYLCPECGFKFLQAVRAMFAVLPNDYVCLGAVRQQLEAIENEESA